MLKCRCVLFLTCLSAFLLSPLAATDIGEVFQKINHPRFYDSVRPFVGGADNGPELNKDLYGRAKETGIVDLKNHYLSFSMDNATGGFIRTYVLYFSPEGRPIFVGSERNSGPDGRYADYFALCQDAVSNWADCTESFFPKLTVRDLLSAGKQLDDTTASLLFLYYELPRKGTTVYLKMIFDPYAYEPADLKRMKKELAKFKKQKFPLTWDKKNRKLVISGV